MNITTKVSYDLIAASRVSDIVDRVPTSNHDDFKHLTYVKNNKREKDTFYI